MLSPGSLVIVLVFSIPLLAILMGGLKEVLQFKAKQSELGHSTHDLERRLDTLTDRLETVETERDRLQQRVEHLETIVTAEAWDALQRVQDGDDEALPAASDLDIAPVDSSSGESPAESPAEDIETLDRKSVV